MKDKVIDYITEHQMIQKGDRIVAGVSGGADSVCLFRLLEALQSRFSLRLFAVHVNHGLRGKEADDDQKFVEDLGKRFQVPVRSFKMDVKAYAKKNKMTEEEAGRSLRYEAFYEALKETEADKIAVAHNAEDNAETMLFHLARGSGLKGLCGIPPVRDRIIRPLLCVSRTEIEQFLNAICQPYRTDPSNRKDDYARNRIRHHILPFMTELLNKNTVRHMGKTAEFLTEAYNFIEKNTEIAYQRHVRNINGQYLCRIAPFSEEDTIIQKEVLKKIIKNASGSEKDVEARHVELLLGLLRMESGKRISLPFGLIGAREYDWLKIGPPEEKKERYEIPITEEGEYILPGFDQKIRVSIEREKIKLEEIPKNDYTKWFDYDKIIQHAVFRRRREGDYFQITKDGGRKKLKDYFIDKKIPRDKRDLVVLLADGSHIIWILGDRISEYYKITENTERVLKVNLYGR